MAKFTITHREEDGHQYVAVSNEAGDHLFCHTTAAKARRMLEEEHRSDVAAIWQNPAHAPALIIEEKPRA